MKIELHYCRDAYWFVLNELYIKNIIKVTKSLRLPPCTVEMKNAYRILVRKLEVAGPLRRLTRWWEDNINTDLKK